jgi:hypothetical protein
MGQGQTRELRVIYVQDQFQRVFPLCWPTNYDELLDTLADTFGYHPPLGILVFDDASSHDMHVCNQHTFQALAPRHRALEPDLHVFHVGLSLAPSAPPETTATVTRHGVDSGKRSRPYSKAEAGRHQPTRQR